MATAGVTWRWPSELDLHHHFLSGAMMGRVKAALPGVEVDLDEQEVPDDGEWFYAAVTE